MELESRPFKPPRRAVISQIRLLLLAFKGDNSLEETGIDQLAFAAVWNFVIREYRLRLISQEFHRLKVEIKKKKIDEQKEEEE